MDTNLTHLAHVDTDHALEIAPRVWWVGHVLPDDVFQCHVYLLEQGDQSVLFDPGSRLTFSASEARAVRPSGHARRMENPDWSSPSRPACPRADAAARCNREPLPGGAA